MSVFQVVGRFIIGMPNYPSCESPRAKDEKTPESFDTCCVVTHRDVSSADGVIGG